jgi:hypothetical protein
MGADVMGIHHGRATAQSCGPGAGRIGEVGVAGTITSQLPLLATHFAALRGIAPRDSRMLPAWAQLAHEVDGLI